jgi:hypothetical protein
MRQIEIGRLRCVRSRSDTRDRSAPAATTGRTACHRRLRPPHRPALLEPLPPPVGHHPDHPSRPGSVVILRQQPTSPPPSLSFFLAFTGVAALIRVMRRLWLDPCSPLQSPPWPAAASPPPDGRRSLLRSSIARWEEREEDQFKE